MALKVDESFGLLDRRVIMLVMAGKPVDATIGSLLQYLEPGDCIIDGGNEWCACSTVRTDSLIVSAGEVFRGPGARCSRPTSFLLTRSPIRVELTLMTGLLTERGSPDPCAPDRHCSAPSADCTVRWGRYENTERRAAEVAEKGIKYIGMGVSGGEEGARNGAPAEPLSRTVCYCGRALHAHTTSLLAQRGISCKAA